MYCLKCQISNIILYEDFIRALFQPVTTPSYYLPLLYNRVDAQMAATMYSAALMPTQSYPMPLILCTNFFSLLTTMPMPYYEELICPSALHLIPTAIQISSAPA